MKSTLSAKLIQHFLKKKKDGGFTLIELLVVIIIIGILAAIALPSFLNQANKAKQSEAKTYTGSMNRAQQAYFLEEGSFTEAIPELGLGIKDSTKNYSYTIDAEADAGTSGTAGRAANIAIPLDPAQANPSDANNDASAVKAYVGGVMLGEVTTGTTTEATTLAVLCEALKSPANGGLADLGDYTFSFGGTEPACDNTTDWKDLSGT